MPINNGTYGGHSVIDFRTFLQLHVAEVVFVRRRRAKDPSVTSRTRRMVCTLNFKILNSEFGKKNLKFKPARQNPEYSAASRGLITVWDIIMQNWREVDVQTAVIIQKPIADAIALPMMVNNEEELVKFIDYYDKKIARMSVGEKRKFMDT
jgi:hypothetical protein